MKLVATVLALTTLRADAACPCLAKPSDPAAAKRTAATGKPAYPGEVDAYGWGCAAHDKGYDSCKDSKKLADGMSDDWCEDQWCAVDPNNCDDKRNLEISYTAEKDWFSYEACDANFMGNGWVGRCKNCKGNEAHLINSFCTCGGLDGCKCKPGAKKQEQADGKPAYPASDPAYGSGCGAWDKGHDSCGTSNKTAAGSADDWCEDEWCIVDKATCKFKAIAISYTKDPDDYFSYETCDAAFMGNGWVGRCKCEKPYDNTYCTCPKGTTTGTKVSGTTSAVVSAMVPMVISALALVIRK